ncbi:hypothetical protein HLB23_12835 [Nocardia uniformis]|uniref:Uncharacterized protein n=1 Tax=Nocardia uniformis TaxID=53432 RepID=A0A849C772_9NOCA|nr:hypothetical protein [Nocardia uniformis]NNH70739.1 hypothetical protein [Nocardia uniformis]
MVKTTFRELIDRAGPFASVYFDSTRDTEDAARQLDLRCRSVRDKLSAAGATDRMLGALDIAFAAGPAALGPSGRALIADTATVLVDEQIPEPPPRETVRVSSLPFLLPLIEQRSPRAPHTQVATSAHDLVGRTEPHRADEAVPAAAVAGGSDIVPLDGQLTLPDGVGALLRYRTEN